MIIYNNIPSALSIRIRVL